ncbi:ribose transport system ATP-binding protein [Agrococcus sp. UYP10]|uniref:sugar ABC transporter ATP-binding protein n=1 Tax=Agrococcus sp. UYP10 TaxID=1756355 RepID=UPI00339A6D9E
MTETSPLVRLSGVHKRYGGVRALRGASLTAAGGEVHGLLGPNGSGKSTLGKVLAGSVRPDEAEIELAGQPVRIGSPRAAARLGVAAVYQQLSLVPELTVGENLVLGSEPATAGFLSGRAARKRARPVLERLAPALGAVHADQPVRELTPGQQQLVEIGKALLREPRILILDEATASLHRDQVAVVFEIVRELRDRGAAVLFVSHRLDEITELCDRATILRSGETVAETAMAGTTPDGLVQLMVGDVQAVEREHGERPSGRVRLTARGLAGGALRGVDLEARAGEVVGLGGLQGQGQSELLLALFGATAATGDVEVDGEPVRLASPRSAAARGIALVPGDRGTQGTLPPRPIQENLAIASLGRRTRAGVISARRERTAAESMVEALAIKIGGLGDPISSLSGGNAQKVVFGKWLLTEPGVVLLDDPTKGVDVGAKAEIYRIIRRMADDGATVIINSSEDRELVTVCDRVLVLFEGAVRAELVGDEITEERLVQAALVIGEGQQAPGQQTQAQQPARAHGETAPDDTHEGTP